MYILDILLRYSAVTMLLVIAILAWRDGKGFKQRPYIILVGATVAFMLLGTVPAALQLPMPVHQIIRVLDIGNIVFIWWLGLSIFDDGFKLRWPHWLVFAANVGILLPSRILEMMGKTDLHSSANYALDLLTFVIMGQLIFITLKGRADDLIEPRRRLRLFFVLAMIGATVTAILAENFLQPNHNEFLSTLRCMIVFPMALWGLLWLSQFHLERVSFEPREVPPLAKPAIDPRDAHLLDRLQAAMDDEKIYTQPGLTIRLLAAHLSAPEHRLRQLINQGLGYRNFSAYLNAYRIAAIKQVFDDPQMGRVPVLTIALDIGYNSLAPFNKAFKASEGMTPSAYRQRGNAAQ